MGPTIFNTTTTYTPVSHELKVYIIHQIQQINNPHKFFILHSYRQY